MNTRKPLLIPSFAVALAMLATPARADIPSPNDSSVPSHLVLVGTDANGVPDPLGTFTVTVNHYGGRPYRNGEVTLSFEDTYDLIVCGSPSAQVVCYGGRPYVKAFTDFNGQVTFHVLGRANHSQPDPGVATLEVYCDGVLLRTIPVAAFDQDGGGVNPADQSLWLQDFFSGQYHERSDFDGDGTLGPSDLSLWRQAFFDAGSISNCASVSCP